MSRPEEKRLLGRQSNWIFKQWQAILCPLVSIRYTVTTHITLTSPCDDAQNWGLSLAILTYTGLWHFPPEAVISQTLSNHPISTSMMQQSLLNILSSQSHSDAPHLVGLLWHVISPSQRHLPDNMQHSQEQDIYGPGRIQTCNHSKRAAADSCLWCVPAGINQTILYNRHR
jgi:hypothetical protein